MPGVIATGKTKLIVEKNIFDAMQFHLEGLKVEHAAIPGLKPKVRYLYLLFKNSSMQNQRLQKGFIYTGLITGLFGLVLQFILMLQTRQAALPESLIRFFSFFTILSNIMVVIFFTGHLLPASKKLNNFVNKNEAATAMCMYILTVGVVYQTILRQPIPLQGWPRIADDILHLYIPLLMLVYWMVFISSKKIDTKTIPYWLIYPAFYLVYTLVRGSIVKFYPYPFVNVDVLGYGKVWFNSALLVLFFVGLSYLFAGIANWRHRQTATG